MLEITEQNKDHIAVIKKIKTIIKNFKNLNKELARIGKWKGLNIYDKKSVRCSQCDRFIGEVDYDAVVILPKCGHCANPLPEGDDKVLYTVSKYNKNPQSLASSANGITER